MSCINYIYYTVSSKESPSKNSLFFYFDCRKLCKHCIAALNIFSFEIVENYGKPSPPGATYVCMPFIPQRILRSEFDLLKTKMCLKFRNLKFIDMRKLKKERLHLLMDEISKDDYAWYTNYKKTPQYIPREITLYINFLNS